MAVPNESSSIQTKPKIANLDAAGESKLHTWRLESEWGPAWKSP